MDDYGEALKAIPAVAKLGTTALEKADKLCSAVFGEPVSELSGMVADRVKCWRLLQAIDLFEKAKKKCEERGIAMQPVAPKLAFPLLEYASLEDDATLKETWANLLANAMDPEFNGEIRYAFIEMIRNITGTDALILNEHYQTLLSPRPNDDVPVWKTACNVILRHNKIMKALEIDEDSYFVCIHNLLRLQCLSANHYAMAGSAPEVSLVYLNPLGIKFIEACMSEE